MIKLEDTTMTKKYNQPTVMVANIAMTSFLCASPAPSGQGFEIEGGDLGDAV